MNKKTAFITPDELQSLFNDHEKRMKVYYKKEIRKALKEILAEHKQIIMDYDKALMENGSIDENLNAIHSAPKIAEFLIDEMLMSDLKPEILQRYKTSGKPFTLDTARKAVTFARTRKKKQG